MDREAPLFVLQFLSPASTSTIMSLMGKSSSIPTRTWRRMLTGGLFIRLGAASLPHSASSTAPVGSIPYCIIGASPTASQSQRCQPLRMCSECTLECVASQQLMSRKGCSSHSFHASVVSQSIAVRSSPPKAPPRTFIPPHIPYYLIFMSHIIILGRSSSSRPWSGPAVGAVPSVPGRWPLWSHRQRGSRWVSTLRAPGPSSYNT